MRKMWGHVNPDNPSSSGPALWLQDIWRLGFGVRVIVSVRVGLRFAVRVRC